MKKLILLMLLAGFAAFTSCKKDDNKGESLAGTSWYYSGYDEEFELEFTSATTVLVYEWDGYREGEYTGTYTYDPPKVTVTANGTTLTGSISGNSMSMAGMTLRKQ